jgi:hypothetical protein
MLCNYCSASNEKDASFCINCGESLSKFRRVKKLLYKKLSQVRSLVHKVYLLQTLFDVSFEHLVIFKKIKWIYGLSVLSAGLIALLFVIAGFRVSPLLGMVMALVGAPLVFLLITLYSRVLLEMVLVNSRRVDQKAEPKRQPESPESVDNIQWNI